MSEIVQTLGPSAGTRDEEFDTFVLSDSGEDLLLDGMEETLSDLNGGYVARARE